MKKGFTLIEVLIVIAIFWVLFFLITFGARMEAKQFNRFSKTKITWFDALWADYRILPDK